MKPAVSVAVLLLAAGMLQAQERSAPVVLRLPSSPLVSAMGDAGVAVRGTSEVLFYNPANLIIGVGTAVAVERRGGSSTAGYLSHRVPHNSWAIGFGARFLDFGAQPGEIPHPAELGNRGPLLSSSLAATVGVSRTVLGLRTGIAISYGDERRSGERESVVLVDVGLARDVGPVSLGLAARNLGDDAELDQVEFRTPARFALGGQLRPRAIATFFDAGLVAEVALDRGGRLEAAGGGEVSWIPVEGWEVTLRAGVRRTERVDALGARPYTGGVGVSIDRFSVDYTIDPYRGGGTAHRFGLRIR